MPKQSSWNEAIDEIVERTRRGMERELGGVSPHLDAGYDREEAKAAINQAVLEHVIQNDWPHHCDLEYMKCDQCRNRMVLNGRNYEQRKIIGEEQPAKI